MASFAHLSVLVLNAVEVIVHILALAVALKPLASLTINSLAFALSTAFDSLSVHGQSHFHHSIPKTDTERRTKRRQKKAGDSLMASSNTLSFTSWSIWEIATLCVWVGVCVCVVGERLQLKPEGKEFWFICPDLVIATFKGIAGNGDGWRLLGLHFFPSQDLWSEIYGDQQEDKQTKQPTHPAVPKHSFSQQIIRQTTAWHNGEQ